MGIFGGKRARATVTAPEPLHLLNPLWRAEPGLLTCAAKHVDDDGCEGEEAYGIRFRLDGDPAPALTVWAYPSYAGPDGLFEPGFCTEYQTGDWTWKQWAPGPGYQHSLEDAQIAARTLAEGLAGTAHPVCGPESESLGFDWDGTPW